MGQDAFSRFHPWVNFLFFAGALGFGMVLQHPAYLLAGVVCALGYCLLLQGRRCLAMLPGLGAMFAILALVNPLFNRSGPTVLFTVFGNPYTLEALCYGAALGAMFVLVMLWFACYSQVLTSDKFICLFGSLAPSLSLLLVMVLRLIPAFVRKAGQLRAARVCIGKGGNEGSTLKEKLHSGATVLSALTDWALEGSIVTADSMRARGYGTAKRTSFRTYRMTVRDWVAIAVELGLCAVVALGAASGAADASYTPWLYIPYPTWEYAAYWALLLIPLILEGKERLQWHYLRSKI